MSETKCCLCGSDVDCIVVCDECFNEGEDTSSLEKLRADAEKLAVALEKTIKENTIMLNEQKCARDGHDWEPDTSLTIMRCDRCGLGMNTNDSRQTLAEFRKRWPKELGDE